MLQKLKVTNFKKHEDLEVAFTAGTNLIFGKNWAGKSSLLWGVVYALFGPSAVPGGSKLVTRLGNRGKTSVTLWFGIGTDDYCVTRSQDRTDVVKNGASVASGAAAATGYLETLLGMSAQDFTSLRFAQQNEAAAILTLGTAKLSQIINQVTKVDVVEKIVDKASLISAVIQKQLEGIPEHNLESLQETARESAAALEAAHVEMMSAHKLLDRLSEDKVAADHELAEANQEIAEYHKHAREVEYVTSEISRLEGQLELTREAAAIPVEDISELERQIIHLVELDKVARAIEKHHADLNSLNSRLAASKAALDGTLSLAEAQEEYSSWANACDEVLAERLRLSTEVRQTAEALKTAACPTCHRPFENHDPAAIQQTLEKLNSELMAVTKKLETAEANKKTAAEVLAKISELAQRAQNTEWMLDSIRSALASDAEAKSSIDAILAEFSHSLTLQEANTLLANRRARNSKATEAIRMMAILERSIGDLRVSLEARSAPHPERQPTASRVQAELSEAVKKASEAFNAIRHRHVVLSMNAEVAQRKLKAATEAEQQRVSAEHSLADHKKLVKYLRDNRNMFTTKVWESTLSRCSTFISQATCGQITELTRSADGQFQYLEEGSWMPVGAASGVQQAVIGVGVRLALVEALRAPGTFLLLDEVTAGSHDDLSLEIVRALKEAQDQIILVSHRQSDAAVADNLIAL